MSDNSKYIDQAYFRIDNVDDRSVSIIVNSCGEETAKISFRTKMDMGRRDYYLMYMLGGRMEAEIAGRSCVLERGSVVCVSPNTPYYYSNTLDSGEYVRYRWIHFTGHEVDPILRSCEITPNQVVNVEVKEEIIGLWEDLFYVFRNKTSEINKLSSIILPYILMKIGRSKVENEKDERKLDLSIKHIHTHLSSPLSIEELSAMEFLSPSRYREVFRKVTGHSPSEYITLLRIRKASELLSEGSATIEETALEVGYTDRLYFQRVFKKHMGITPGAYLKKMHGKI